MLGLIIVNKKYANMKIIEMVIVTIDSLIYLSDISLLNKETVFSLHIAFKTKIKLLQMSLL